MPRPFRVRYSVSDPTQHEILDPILYVFAMKPFLQKMTPSNHAPWTSRKERRAHLAAARLQELSLSSLASGQELRVRFNPQKTREHSIELPPLREGEVPPVLSSSTVTYQLEPLVYPASRV
jgi:hypothetical protein